MGAVIKLESRKVMPVLYGNSFSQQRIGREAKNEAPCSVNWYLPAFSKNKCGCEKAGVAARKATTIQQQSGRNLKPV